MNHNTAIVWFRRDLRLADNPALNFACNNYRTIIPIFIWAPEEEAPWSPGAASKWWLYHSLQKLQKDLANLGAPLILRRGPTLESIKKIQVETNACAIFWNRLNEPALIARDRIITSSLMSQSVKVETFNSQLLLDPWEITNKAGNPYKVFTAYCNCFFANYKHQSLAKAPKRISGKNSIRSLELAELKLLPNHSWTDGLAESWAPGEMNGQKLLKDFLSSTVNGYTLNRDFPAILGTSKLSPYLHFGEISPRQIWETIARSKVERDLQEAEVNSFLRQLVWREFANYLLYHFPHTPNSPLRPEFATFPWTSAPSKFKAWKKGLTGYPIVDAGMRELWQTGWMHNRVRMIAGSFLVKDLLINWLDGAKWFWDTLVDADLANNTLGWQWVSGCGADAAPYFRIFNPDTQQKKFDPDGIYRSRYIPELEPSATTEKIHSETNAKIKSRYPRPIIAHSEARTRALLAYEKIKVSNATKD